MFEGDDRGQSMQIGAILLFGLLVVGLSFTQAFVVPQENRGVEFGSYVEASDDLTAYYHDVLAAGTQGSQTGQTVETGVRYPTRTILVNPSPAAGTIRTTATRNVTIGGVQAVSGEDRNVRGFWDTDARGPRNYSTRYVEFDPGYNELDASPVVVSSVGTYRLGSGGQVALTEQSFLAGNRITLVTVDGDVEAGGISTSLSAAPTSVATRSVTVTGDGGSDFTITLPVPGDATAWNVSSGARSLRGNPNVVGTEVNASRVDVTFDGDARYTLRLAKVTVHDRSDSGVETEPDPAYVVPVEGNGSTAVPGDSRPVVVEVRDQYNNPVAGVDVTFDADGGTFAETGTATRTVTTTDDGRARVGAVIQTGESTLTMDASFAGGVAPFDETTLTLTNAEDDGGGINPGGPDDLALVDATIQSGPCGGADCQVDVDLKNFDSNEQNVTALSFHFYGTDDQGGGGGSSRTPPDTVEVDGVTLTNGGDFEPLGRTVAAGSTTTLQLAFTESGSGFDVQQGDFFILTARIDTTGDGVADETATYFVGPKS